MATPRPITAAIAATARELALLVYPAPAVLVAPAAVPESVPVPVGLDVAVAGVEPLFVPEGVRVAVSMSETCLPASPQDLANACRALEMSL